MCRKDPIFFINTFCWTAQQTWKPEQPEQPFITFPAQDEVIRKLWWAIGKRDVCGVKSRETGWSWMALYVMLQRWLFFRAQSFLVVSRTQDLVDSPKDLDALIPKLDFSLVRLPAWMTPSYERTQLKLYNLDQESVISGASTTGNIGRGGRRTAILLDEFAFFDRQDSYRALAASQGTSKCRWFVSTPNGVGNAFYDVAHSRTERIDFSWEDIPFKRAGLYTTGANGNVRVLDEDYQFPEDYPYILDGKRRSPWYDEEWLRTPIASVMAQEHDRDFLGSGRPFFDPTEIQRLLLTSFAPRVVGEMGLDDPPRFRSTPKGRLRFWFNPDARGDAPADRAYCIGVDISAGTGASNSCISVLDMKTGEKVGEFVSPHVRPEALAEMANAMGRYFRDFQDQPAYMIWESQGPGTAFGARLLELGYSNVHYHRDPKKTHAKKTQQPGFGVSKDSKQMLLFEYARALASGEYLNRSAEALRECGEYAYLEGGGIGHVKSVSTMDPSGARDNHGDRVIADALSWLGHKSTGSKEMKMETVPESCLHQRIEDRRRERSALEQDKVGWLVG